MISFKDLKLKQVPKSLNTYFYFLSYPVSKMRAKRGKENDNTPISHGTKEM